jgi:hypothetical protein
MLEFNQGSRVILFHLHAKHHILWLVESSRYPSLSNPTPRAPLDLLEHKPAVSSSLLVADQVVVTVDPDAEDCHENVWDSQRSVSDS